MKKNLIHNGVEITTVEWFGKTFYYPAFNGDLEFRSLDEIKAWIDGPYQFVKSQCEWLGEQMGVSGNAVFGFINNHMSIPQI